VSAWGGNVVGAELRQSCCLQIFLCRRLVHASALCIGRYFVEVPGIAPSTDAQSDSTIVEILLGCW
jgi:hypothetical protein